MTNISVVTDKGVKYSVNVLHQVSVSRWIKHLKRIMLNDYEFNLKYFDVYVVRQLVKRTIYR